MYGDSGGPLVVGPAAHPYIAGVFSFFSPLDPCGASKNIWSSVVAQKMWLDSVLAVAAGDSDGDGVPDECDECALGSDHERCSPGSAAPGVPKACAPPCGCEPDADGDGICDKEDACPHAKPIVMDLPEVEVEGRSAPSDILLSWPDADDVPDLRGISGSPIWEVSESEPGGLWHPSKELKLVGIQHTVSPGRWIKGTRWSVVERCIDSLSK